MEYVKSFKELEVYKLAYEISSEIFELTKTFPKEENYSLTDQIRRSSRSIGAQIAESWGKRRYNKHFISKLSDACAEAYETGHWLEIAHNCGYISKNDLENLLNKCLKLEKMLNSMMNKSDLFKLSE